MNEESIRVAIAKICYPQYSNIEPTYDYTLNDDYEKDWAWSIEETNYYNSVVRLPDYYNSLDACAEFEKYLSQEDREGYVWELMQMTLGVDTGAGFMLNLECIAVLLNATAPQKCEAFLKLKKKWID